MSMFAGFVGVALTLAGGVASDALPLVKPGVLAWTTVELRYPSNGGSTAWIVSDPAANFACDPPTAAPPGPGLPLTVRCHAMFPRTTVGRPAVVMLRARYALVAGVGNVGPQGIAATGRQWVSGCNGVDGDTCRIALSSGKVSIVIDPALEP